jgi:hypothetical protein
MCTSAVLHKAANLFQDAIHAASDVLLSHRTGAVNSYTYAKKRE